jgi:hypothetical protein
MNPRNFFTSLNGRHAAKSQTKGSIWKPGNQDQEGGEEVNNQERRKSGNQVRIPAINLFSCFPALLIHLLPASRRGSSRAETNPCSFFAEPKRRGPRFQTRLKLSIAAERAAAL